jgi:hypothetical protein
MTQPEVKWQTPSGRAGTAGAAAQTAALLRANPKEWAIIEEFAFPTLPENATPEQEEAVKAEAKKVRARASSRASLIKQGRVAAYKNPDGSAGAFNAVSRSELDDNGSKVIRVYATFVGDGVTA